MQQSQLGTSGLHLSRIGYGCMSLHDDSPQNIRLLHEAVELGVNYFDTADIYDKGLNEQLVGKAFRGRRNQVVIATKAGNVWKPDGSGLDWNASKQHIVLAVEASLQRLQTDYIDLYQLHGGTLDDPLDDTIAAFEQLRQQGKIRAYGISSIRPNVIREYVKRSAMVSVMMQYSLLDRWPEEEALPLLHKHQVGVLARGSVAGGLLVDKPAKPYLQYSPEQVAQAAAAIEKVSGDHRSPAQTAIQFVLNNPAITAAIVGIRTSAQLREAVEALTRPALSAGELQLLTSSLPPSIYGQHR